VTDIQYGGKKKVNRENKRNDIDRPQGDLGNKQVKARYTNHKEEPIE
jgi:hypothetical protein